MKRNNKLKYLAGALLLGTSLVSCKKYIDLAPEDATYDQVFWSTGDNVDKAISGAYGLIRTAFRDTRSYFTLGDLPADEFILDAGTFWNYQDLLATKQYHYSYAPYLEDALHNWTRFYGIINQCHLIVENGEKIPVAKYKGGQEQKNAFVGEGHFLRAYIYFYLTKVWGEPVITRESLKNPTDVQPIPRSTDQEALEYCISDLKKAAALLDFNKGTASARIRADKGAAWAMLAHVYAWKRDFATAKLYCDSVIERGGYTLEPMASYANIWKGTSGESILELFMKYDAANQSESSAGFFGDFLADPLIRNKGINTSWRVNEDLFNQLYDPSDLRAQQVFTAVLGESLLTKYANVNYFDPNRPNTYVVDNNLVLLRLSDIHLLRAEALFEEGNSTAALSDMNVIRQRAGLDPLTVPADLTIDEIYDERVRELYGEGHVAFDKIRMLITNPDKRSALPEPYTTERVDKKGYNWPLAMRKLLPQNVLLTQNEWWKNH